MRDYLSEFERNERQRELAEIRVKADKAARRRLAWLIVKLIAAAFALSLAYGMGWTRGQWDCISAAQAIR